MSGSTKIFVNNKVSARRIMVFGKSKDPDSHQVKQILEQYLLPKDSYEWIDIETRQDCKQMENYFRTLCFTDRRQTPYIFIDQLYFGSLFELNLSHKDGSLKNVLLK
ncbi:unnamed protein product [Rotaria socialis]|uniref:Glutaredoxin domain-containing protein n=1 Tax=Rotaria socialis TaxID=392032 RepID=A0A820GT95_9BILA|nr:unnamed protein product [Rotaria socialis]CAF3475689.1 unnamed protein product [Rotaria socialis]CAF4284569.1 unnamed protein product [Rotaria socialis]CAF4486871.1 unnamed protein product [Rotaria socialis]